MHIKTKTFHSLPASTNHAVSHLFLHHQILTGILHLFASNLLTLSKIPLRNY